MAEQCDTPKPTNKAETPELNYQAFIFSSQSSEDVSLKETLDTYDEYLDEHGFDVAQENSDCLDDVKKKIAEKLSHTDAAAVIVLVGNSDIKIDVDEIVKCLTDCSNSTSKPNVLVFCRIGNPESEETADCLMKMDTRECKEKLRNVILFNAVVATKSLVTEFLKDLLDKMKNFWESNGIGYIAEYGFIKESQKYGLKTRNGLTKEFKLSRKQVMLKDINYFKKVIGDGSQLKQLDGIAAKYLKELAGKSDVSLDVYRNSGPRKALIINNLMFPKLPEDEQRTGSEMDIQNLKHALEIMNYKVTVELNKTAVDIEQLVKNFANNVSHGTSCVLAIMSHGSDGKICGTNYSGTKAKDDDVVSESELLKNMQIGAAVKGKPRLVIIQACRNVDKKEGTCSPGEVSEIIGRQYGNPATSFEPTPDQCGMVVARSTSSGHFSYRSPQGSRFILSLCGIFYKYAHKEDVVSMIEKVNFVMTHGFGVPKIEHKPQPMQLPEWIVQTDKKFFLVDTDPLFDCQETPELQQGAAAGALKPDRISGEVTDSSKVRREP